MNVSLKSVEAANAKLQLGRVGGLDRDLRPQTFVSASKVAPPSRAEIAQAGQRALESLKK